MLGCPWQRCTVHFLRDCLGHARKDQHGLLAALIRPIFRAESRRGSPPAARRGGLAARASAAEGRRDARGGRGGHPRLLRIPLRALAQAPQHQPAERFNREIGRRTDVVGIFPDDPSLIRLLSMLAIEANDEWLVGRGYISLQSMEPLLEERLHRPQTEEVLELTAA